jgi:DNA segregation ATPase FtsK/SpoIIIE-like protein
VVRGESTRRSARSPRPLGVSKTDLPFLVLIFDEFADLVLAEREDKKDFETLVALIAGNGRAAGIHLVPATQRPDRAVVTGLIKSNLPLKVCLKVTNAVNAQIVLDEPGAESLFGKGDLLCDFGRGLVRAQGLCHSTKRISGGTAPKMTQSSATACLRKPGERFIHG